MDLPPDFWSLQDIWGWAGIFIGMVIGQALVGYWFGLATVGFRALARRCPRRVSALRQGNIAASDAESDCPECRANELKHR